MPKSMTCACGRVNVIADENLGNTYSCPGCGRPFMIPAAEEAPLRVAPVQPDLCPSCRQPVSADALLCAGCGARLKGESPAPAFVAPEAPRRSRTGWLVGGIIGGVILLAGAGVLIAVLVGRSHSGTSSGGGTAPTSATTKPTGTLATGTAAATTGTAPTAGNVLETAAGGFSTATTGENGARLKPMGYFVSPGLPTGSSDKPSVRTARTAGHAYLVILAQFSSSAFAPSERDFADMKDRYAKSGIAGGTLDVGKLDRDASRFYRRTRLKLLGSRGKSQSADAIAAWTGESESRLFHFEDFDVPASADSRSRTEGGELIGIAFDVVKADAMPPFTIQLDSDPPVTVTGNTMAPPEAAPIAEPAQIPPPAPIVEPVPPPVPTGAPEIAAPIPDFKPEVPALDIPKTVVVVPPIIPPPPPTQTVSSTDGRFPQVQAADVKPFAYLISPKLRIPGSRGSTVRPTEQGNTFVVAIVELPPKLFVASDAAAQRETTPSKAGSRRGLTIEYDLDRFTLVVASGEKFACRAVTVWDSLRTPAYTFGNLTISSSYAPPTAQRVALAFSIPPVSAKSPFSIQVDGCDPVVVPENVLPG